MRGRFTPGAADEEWCERRLLARIHRYTLKRLRAEIEPVAARDFLRFLFAWQRVAPERAWSRAATRSSRWSASSKASRPRPAPGRPRSCRRASPATSRPGSTTAALPAASPGRGSAAQRAARNGASAAPVRTTPITLLRAPPRRAVGARWRRRPIRCSRARAPRPSPTSCAEHGASFFDEMAAGTRPAAHPARGGAGRAGRPRPRDVRQLRRPARAAGAVERAPAAGVVADGAADSSLGMEDAGRWALVRRARSAPTAAEGRPGAVEHLARTLLRRYGVVFWRLLEREASGCRPGASCCAFYRRLEARGEIRGGRFVAGLLRRAVRPARRDRAAARGAPASRRADAWSAVSGADPLNLAGIMTPGPRLAALTGNRLLYRDGLPAAILSGGEIRMLEELDSATEWFARKALMRTARQTLSADGAHRRIQEDQSVLVVAPSIGGRARR